MRAVLHVGVEKTGTTSIQRFMALNHDLLKTQSILYPLTLGHSNHMRLAAFAAADDKRDDLRARFEVHSHEDLLAFRDQVAGELEAEVKAAGCDTVVMSNEHCSSRLVTHEEVERLRNLLRRVFDEVRVVIYLRRQDEFLLSSYSTQMRCGEVERLSLPTTEERCSRYDFSERLDLWSGVFGKHAMTVRLFSRATLVDGSAVSDFVQSAGLPGDLPYQMPSEENRSLDNDALELLRLLNAHIPYLEDGKLFQERGNLPALLEKISSGPGVMMEPEPLQTFMRSFAEGNLRVAQEYFGGELHAQGDPLFGPSPDFRDRKIPEPISVEKAVEIFAKLWILKQQQVDQLQRRIARLSGA